MYSTPYIVSPFIIDSATLTFLHLHTCISHHQDIVFLGVFISRKKKSLEAGQYFISKSKIIKQFVDISMIVLFYVSIKIKVKQHEP